MATRRMTEQEATATGWAEFPRATIRSKEKRRERISPWVLEDVPAEKERAPVHDK